MNENEQLARWLFGESDGVDDHGDKLWWFDGLRVWGTPPFRNSNQWAGVLLEKLGKDEVTLAGVGSSWEISTQDELKPTWRDAVVDAALEVMRRESNEGAKHEG